MNIELKPAGLETPEGVARVNRAMEAQENAILGAANALSELLRELKGTKLPGYARAAVDVAEEAHKARKDADEELLRAVANAPVRH